MKKMFLLAGIIAFSVASAQQNDIFDIQEHLTKKNQLNKELAKDNLFKYHVSCFGNYKQYDILVSKHGMEVLKARTKTKVLSELINSNKVDSIPENNMVFNFSSMGTNEPFPLAKFSHTLPNGNKIYLLPQDNMPCVVPGMEEFNMPVVKAEILPYNIPNPAYPPQSKIETFTPEKIKELQELFNKKLNK